MKPFFVALSFLTTIRIWGTGNWEDGRKILYFPLVGLIIGGLLCGIDALASMVLHPQLVATIDVLFLAIITGGLHLDGLADTADGFLSHRSKNEILEIMHDSRIGVMGTLAIVFCILFKVAGILGIQGGRAWVWLLAAPAIARAALTSSLVFMDYARNEGGISSSFFQKNRYSMLLLCPLPLGIPFIEGVVAGITTLFIFFAITILFFVYCNQKIDGVTGDTLGAATEIIETAILVFGGLFPHFPI